MSGQDTSQQNKIAYQLTQYVSNDSLEYIYRGNVNSAIAENILCLAENNIGQSREKILIRKRIYFIMVECLQNITRHQEKITDRRNDNEGLFIMRKKKFAYYITSGNLIKNDTIDSLKEKIEKINNLDAEKLKEYSRQVLDNGTFSSKGGAGLGLIEMARKSGRKFRYEFVKLDDEYSFFYLHLSIPYNKVQTQEEDPEEERKEYDLWSVKDIIKFHKILTDNNILLNFNGVLKQDNLKNLMSILSRQITTSKVLKTRVYSSMIEILQNILQHADNKDETQEGGNYGMFFISEEQEHLKLTAANYIKNEKIAKLRQLIDFANNTDKDKRQQLIRNGEPGHGFATLVNKSHHPLEYSFTPIDKATSLYSITIRLEKDSEIDDNAL
ncbi:MAG: SiaB family protein kinase [Bacteroidales bacterium]|nr:SiaB family protein kinase [Bacteroidales bacterium]